MTVPEVKRILREARKTGLAYKKLKRKALEYEQRLMCGKPVTYNSNGGTREIKGNTVENALCDCVDHQAAAEAAGKALAQPYRQAGTLIYLVKDDRQRDILNRYYMLCQSWEKIAGDLGCTERWIKKLHGYALEKISKNT